MSTRVSGLQNYQQGYVTTDSSRHTPPRSPLTPNRYVTTFPKTGSQPYLSQHTQSYGPFPYHPQAAHDPVYATRRYPTPLLIGRQGSPPSPITQPLRSGTPVYSHCVSSAPSSPRYPPVFAPDGRYYNQSVHSMPTVHSLHASQSPSYQYSTAPSTPQTHTRISNDNHEIVDENGGHQHRFLGRIYSSIKTSLSPRRNNSKDIGTPRGTPRETAQNTPRVVQSRPSTLETPRAVHTSGSVSDRSSYRATNIYSENPNSPRPSVKPSQQESAIVPSIRTVSGTTTTTSVTTPHFVSSTATTRPSKVPALRLEQVNASHPGINSPYKSTHYEHITTVGSPRRLTNSSDLSGKVVDMRHQEKLVDPRHPEKLRPTRVENFPQDAIKTVKIVSSLKSERYGDKTVGDLTSRTEISSPRNNVTRPTEASPKSKKLSVSSKDSARHHHDQPQKSLVAPSPPISSATPKTVESSRQSLPDIPATPILSGKSLKSGETTIKPSSKSDDRVQRNERSKNPEQHKPAAQESPCQSPSVAPRPEHTSLGPVLKSEIPPVALPMSHDAPAVHIPTTPRLTKANSRAAEPRLDRVPQSKFSWSVASALVTSRRQSAATFSLNGVSFDQWDLTKIPTLGASPTSCRVQEMYKAQIHSTGQAKAFRVFMKTIPIKVWERQWEQQIKWSGEFVTDGENFAMEAAALAFLHEHGSGLSPKLLGILELTQSPGEDQKSNTSPRNGSRSGGISHIAIISELYGEDLLDYLDKREKDKFPLTSAEKKDLQWGCARLMKKLHSFGFAHLDFTPENVLRGPQGLRLCDFAKATPLWSTCHRHVSVPSTPGIFGFESCEPTVGKGAYMPPECWKVYWKLENTKVQYPLDELWSLSKPEERSGFYFRVRDADLYMLGVLLFWIWSDGGIWKCSDTKQDEKYNHLVKSGMNFNLFRECRSWQVELKDMLMGALRPEPWRRVNLDAVLNHAWFSDMPTKEIAGN